MFRKSGIHFCAKNMLNRSSWREFLSPGRFRPGGKRAGDRMAAVKAARRLGDGVAQLAGLGR
jgi:hypothetical protein